MTSQQEFLRKRGVPVPIRGTAAASISRLLGSAGVPSYEVQNCVDRVDVFTGHPADVYNALTARGYVCAKPSSNQHGVCVLRVTGKYLNK